jgi:hypothetical protein
MLKTILKCQINSYNSIHLQRCHKLDLQFVIKGDNFVNAPEGGFLVVDDITYDADLLPDVNACKTGPPVARDIDNGHATTPADYGEDITESVINDLTTVSTAATEGDDIDSCHRMQCNFDQQRAYDFTIVSLINTLLQRDSVHKIQ